MEVARRTVFWVQVKMYNSLKPSRWGCLPPSGHILRKEVSIAW